MRPRVWVIAGVLCLVGLYFHARYHFAHDDVAGLYVLEGREDAVTTFELKPDGTFEKDDGDRILHGRWRLANRRFPIYDRGVVLVSNGVGGPSDSFQLHRHGAKVCWEAQEGVDPWCNLAH